MEHVYDVDAERVFGETGAPGSIEGVDEQICTFAQKYYFSPSNLEVSAKKWMQLLTDAVYRGAVPIRDEYGLDKGEETEIPPISRFVMHTIRFCHAMDRSIVWMKYT